MWLNATDCGFDSHFKKWNISFFYFFSLASRQARRWVSPLKTQCHQNSAENKGRSVLTLNSFYPICRIQIIYFIHMHLVPSKYNYILSLTEIFKYVTVFYTFLKCYSILRKKILIKKRYKNFERIGIWIRASLETVQGLWPIKLYVLIELRRHSYTLVTSYLCC